MIILGIDPGQKGGLAKLNLGPKKLNLTFSELNLTPLPNLKRLNLILKELNLTSEGVKILAFIEKQEPRPYQGVKSSFVQAYHYGQLIAVLRLNDIPIVEVRPQDWQKPFFSSLPKSLTEKDRSRYAATRLYPDADFIGLRKRTIQDGLTDAALIATYGARITDSDGLVKLIAPAAAKAI